MLDLVALVEALAHDRPVFHSEADFQHSLAWSIHSAHPGARLRLERPYQLDGQRINLDLMVEDGPDRTAIELKYMTCSLDVEVRGERFQLQQHGAQPLRRYDCWKDLVRLEGLVRTGQATAGIFVALTNDPCYWRQDAGTGKSIDATLRMNQGRAVAPQVLTWAAHTTPKTIRGREAPLPIAGDYTLTWRPYARVAGKTGELRYLLMTVDPSRVALPPLASRSVEGA